MENILVEGEHRNPYERTFKIGDLGLCHFKEGDDDAMVYDVDVQGTKTYGTDIFLVQVCRS
jgi:hypothetical protein